MINCREVLDSEEEEYEDEHRSGRWQDTGRDVHDVCICMEEIHPFEMIR